MSCKVAQVNTVGVSGVCFLPSTENISLQHCYRYYYFGVVGFLVVVFFGGNKHCGKPICFYNKGVKIILFFIE